MVWKLLWYFGAYSRLTQQTKQLVGPRLRHGSHTLHDSHLWLEGCRSFSP